MTPKSMRIKARQLRAEDGALPFAETIVRAVDIVAVEPLAGHAAAIVNAARQALESIVIGDDNAAFSRRHELARLKTEGARGAKCSDAPAIPLGSMSMR